MRIESGEARNGVYFKLFDTQKWSSRPQRPFSLRLPSQAIALASSKVVKVTQESNKKHGQYKR